MDCQVRYRQLINHIAPHILLRISGNDLYLGILIPRDEKYAIEAIMTIEEARLRLGLIDCSWLLQYQMVRICA